MAKIKFLARWRLTNQLKIKDSQDLKDPNNDFLLLEYDRKTYRKYLGQFLMRLDRWENEHGDTREIEVELAIRYKDRSIDQNALMWSLYDIEAKEQNGGMVGTPDQMVNRDELYLADLESWGEKDIVKTTVSRLHYYLTEYRIVRYESQYGRFIKIGEKEKRLLMGLEPDEKITLQITRGTSKYNTVEMANHIQGIFNRLAETVGICDTGQLALYKKDFDRFKKERKITTRWDNAGEKQE